MAYGSPQVEVDSFDDFLALDRRLNPSGVHRGVLRNVEGATHITPVFVKGLGWADCDSEWLDAQGYHDIETRPNDRWKGL
jgi:hypothetical protein